MSDEAAKEKARAAIEDAVYRAIEAGMDKHEVIVEVEYAFETVSA